MPDLLPWLVRGALVRVLRGPNAGRVGTIVRLNGANVYLAFHGGSEMVLRSVGDLRTTGPLYAVPLNALRTVEPYFIHTDNLIPLEDSTWHPPAPTALNTPFIESDGASRPSESPTPPRSEEPSAPPSLGSPPAKS